MAPAMPTPMPTFIRPSRRAREDSLIVLMVSGSVAAASLRSRAPVARSALRLAGGERLRVLDLAPLTLVELREERVLAQLQRLHVRGDRPAIRDRDAVLLVEHRAEAVRDHVEDVARRRLLEAL